MDNSSVQSVERKWTGVQDVISQYEVFAIWLLVYTQENMFTLSSQTLTLLCTYLSCLGSETAQSSDSVTIVTIVTEVRIVCTVQLHSTVTP